MTATRITEKQAAALRFIANNPGANVTQIASAAGASTSGSNDAEMIRHLIDNGLVQIVLTAEASDALGLD
jgi:DNA-binding MarR family transcriptional regulator